MGEEFRLFQKFLVKLFLFTVITQSVKYGKRTASVLSNSDLEHVFITSYLFSFCTAVLES